MNARPTPLRLADSAGYILPAILVFATVLTLAVFSAASLARTRVQVVTNLHREKEALFAADAGIQEALKRLQLKASDPLTSAAAGVAVRQTTVGSATFDASFAFAPVKPDLTDPNWRAEIYFAPDDPLSVPAKVAGTSVVAAPSVQPPDFRLEYASATAPVAAENLENLVIRWKTVGGAIQYAGTTPILQIVSTGRSENATRTITVEALLNSGIPGLGAYGGDCPGVSVHGNTTINVQGGIQINSTCSTALTGVGRHSGLTANPGPINVVGDVRSSFADQVSPAATTGVTAQADPLASMLPPCFVGDEPLPCQGSPLVASSTAVGTLETPAPTQVSSGTVTLEPGVYYGGINIQGGTTSVTLNPGIYVMAGGGFQVSNASLQSATGGVMIYNSRIVGGALGQLGISTNNTLMLSAPSSGDFQGVAIFQDRYLDAATLQPQVSLGGGQHATGRIDGVIYAINAVLTLQGSLTLNSNLIAKTVDAGGGATINPSASLPIANDPFGNGVTLLSWRDF